MAYSIKDIAFVPGKSVYTIARGDKVVAIVQRDSSSGLITQPKEDGKGSEPAPKVLQQVVREHIASLYTQGDY